MDDLLGMPENAWCRKCGYALRGLPRAVCPECGGKFDPADPRTFHGNPPGWRKKLWIRRAAVAVALLFLVACFAPRGLLRSSLAFTCDSCGRVQRFQRIELLPPVWIHTRYPGITLREEREGYIPHVPEAHAALHADMKSDLRRRGKCSAQYACERPGTCSMNGILITPQSAPIFLKEMLAPKNTGIGP